MEKIKAILFYVVAKDWCGEIIKLRHKVYRIWCLKSSKRSQMCQSKNITWQRNYSDSFDNIFEVNFDKIGYLKKNKVCKYMLNIY